ncbi:autotransporter outer membrane beta-barrel domain-containing protein [Thiocapsa rosea]|uniref:Outer membrane autotransporter protein n=1 Tax=Thiocapsa rosea TaxID=69360 RepID=A0A495VD08_9GAMM|nr:autotransporter outer membrane beta-barrel domain-containing protein [Thiocapsa rosea]RKT46315.1 outer membrane autotransporter protein [Thiocapsa rosea]
MLWAGLAIADAPPPFYQEALDAATINGNIAGNAIFQTCITGDNGRGNANNQRFQDDCGIIVLGSADDPSGSTTSLNQLAADQISAQNSAALRAAGLGVAFVQNRLQRIRLADATWAEPTTLLADRDVSGVQAGGAASADVALGPFGGFFSFDYVNGDEDESAYQPGYDFERWAMALSVDYRFNENFIGGLAIRYADEQFDFDNNRGDMSGDSWGGLIYATYFLPNGFFVDGLIGYASNEYTLKRKINYTIDFAGNNVANQIASSDPSASVWNFNLGAGYNLYHDAWVISPALRFNYINNDVDGYRESMSSPNTTGGSMALSISSQTYESLTSDLGVQVSRAISHKNGVFVPQVRVAWIHEFQNPQERVGATFVNDINQQPLFILTNKPDHDYMELGAGVSAQFEHGWSGFVAYNTLLGYDGVSYNAVNAGVRMEF